MTDPGKQPDKETVDRWHRWFAIECNNRAWDLASSPELTDVERQELLFSACAAAFHWSKVGQPVNGMRAEMLLAHTHSLLGPCQEALQYARSCLNFCEQNDCQDWDLAFAHLEMALAGSVVGDTELFARHRAAAAELGGKVEDEEERKIFAAEFARLPAVSAEP